MWKFCEKTTVFPGGYGRIGEIQHGRIWPDWGLKGYSIFIHTGAVSQGLRTASTRTSSKSTLQ